MLLWISVSRKKLQTREQGGSWYDHVSNQGFVIIKNNNSVWLKEMIHNKWKCGIVISL
jgi:hypothetical protein